MGPLGFPWLTFSALLVTAASVIAAIIWAVLIKDTGDNDET